MTKKLLFLGTALAVLLGIVLLRSKNSAPLNDANTAIEDTQAPLDEAESPPTDLGDNSDSTDPDSDIPSEADSLSADNGGAEGSSLPGPREDQAIPDPQAPLTMNESPYADPNETYPNTLPAPGMESVAPPESYPPSPPPMYPPPPTADMGPEGIPAMPGEGSGNATGAMGSDGGLDIPRPDFQEDSMNYPYPVAPPDGDMPPPPPPALPDYPEGPLTSEPQNNGANEGFAPLAE